MTGQLISFTAFGLPLAMILVFRSSRRRLVLIGASLTAGILAFAAESRIEGRAGSDVVPYWVTAIFVVGLFGLWCAGIAVGSFVRRRF